MSDDDEPISQVPDAELARALVGMLHDARKNGGQIDPDTFWQFVGALARGRGIMEGLHQAGLEFLEAEERSPQEDFALRRVQAYHGGLLAKLMHDMDPKEGKRSSVLPGQFQARIVANDLIRMGANPHGMATGEPEILRAKDKRGTPEREENRRAVVSYVYWKAARDGVALAAVLRELPDEINKSTWDGWVRNNPQIVQRAKDAGQRGDPKPPRWPEGKPTPGEDETMIAELLARAKRGDG